MGRTTPQRSKRTLPADSSDGKASAVDVEAAEVIAFCRRVLEGGGSDEDERRVHHAYRAVRGIRTMASKEQRNDLAVRIVEAWRPHVKKAADQRQEIEGVLRDLADELEDPRFRNVRVNARDVAAFADDKHGKLWLTAWLLVRAGVETTVTGASDDPTKDLKQLRKVIEDLKKQHASAKRRT